MKYLIVFLISSISLLSYSQDFRESSWGDSEAQVKTSEGDVEWYEEDDDHQRIIAFEGNVGQRDAVIVFLFTDEKFYSGRYFFAEEYSNENDYLDDYYDIDGFLQEKYGKKKPKNQWASDDLEMLYGENANHYGHQLYMGNLTIYNSWETETTEIMHVLEGQEYEVVHVVYYQNKELTETMGKKILDDF